MAVRGYVVVLSVHMQTNIPNGLTTPVYHICHIDNAPSHSILPGCERGLLTQRKVPDFEYFELLMSPLQSSSTQPALSWTFQNNVIEAFPIFKRNSIENFPSNMIQKATGNKLKTKVC